MRELSREAREVLKDATAGDLADPIVIFIQREDPRRDPKYFCRICGPRNLNITPIRASDVHALPTNPDCDSCHQPCIRP